jgi:hypothetical protein
MQTINTSLIQAIMQDRKDHRVLPPKSESTQRKAHPDRISRSKAIARANRLFSPSPSTIVKEKIAETSHPKDAVYVRFSKLPVLGQRQSNIFSDSQ